MKTMFIHEYSTTHKIIAVITVFFFVVVYFIFFPPPASDYRYVFYPVSQNPLNPYNIKTFVNIPWTAFILYPLHFFSENLSTAINSSLNLVIIGLLVIKRKGDKLSLILTFTSFPFLALLANGSIEWIPAIGFLLQNRWGIPFILTKPQSGSLAIISWLTPLNKKLNILIPAFLLIAVSFIIWGNWLMSLMSNVKYMSDAKIGLFTVNIAPFPWAIPIGLGLIFYILKCNPRNGELLGALSTLCLVPYFVTQSMIIPFSLLSVSHRKLSIICWLSLWALAIITN